ncbi:PDZ domain-containing protein [Hyphomonas oceanitis]|uniref:PDZ domain-containing protein n=1 Tax=Hyphomonas oceanitis TaxID=81033 RepID=UPI003000FE5A
MTEDILIISMIFGVITGCIGIMIAKNKGVNASAGFLLGFFFSIIGLIITALLNPPKMPDVSPKQPDRPSRPARANRNLADPQYRIWLVEEYSIARSDVLDEVICFGTSFTSIGQALEHAHRVELDRALKSGVQVDAVSKGGNADTAGLRCDDIILLYDGQHIGSKEDLVEVAQAVDPASTYIMLILRDGVIFKRSIRGGILGIGGRQIELAEADQKLREENVAKLLASV